MRIKNNNLKLLIIVLILFFCPLFAIINNTFGIYRSTLNTTISLTVLDPSTNYVVTFDENYTGGDTWDVFKTYNEQLGTDYTSPSRTGYNFTGWYTSGGTKISQNTQITANVTYYAHWEKIVCMKAQTGTLHTENCAAGGGCLKHGYTTSGATRVITYGTIPGLGSPVAGDAYDCDVNNDGVYSPTTERFYFIRETTGNNEKAILVHYTSFDEYGQMDNSSDRENYTYDDGKTYLPDSTVWSNPSLTTFNGKVSRYIDHDDLLAGCGGSSVVYDSVDYLSTCQFFLENSRYQSSSLGRSGIWVDKLNNNIYRIQTSSVVIQVPETSSSKNAVRPVIEIPITALDGYRAEQGYTITFETHGGSSVASVTRYAGETLGNIVTTREHFDFDGWYTNFENDQYSGLVTSSTVITGNMTLHAKWSPRETNTVTFDANGGTIDGESTYTLIVDTGTSINEEDFPEAIYEGKDLEGWFIDGDPLFPLTDETIINDDITAVASWTSAHYVAKIGNTKYETLAAAVEAVPQGTSAKTTITLLDNIALAEEIIIPNNKWVELNIGSYTISDSAEYVMTNVSADNALFANKGKLDIINGTITSANPFIIYNLNGGTVNISGGELRFTYANSTDPKVIENMSGTVNITGGSLFCAAKAATINVKGSSTLNVSGGEIKATNTYKGQAIYMEGTNPKVNVSGTAYIENVSGDSVEPRAAIDNNSSGTLTITGGTIVSKGYDAVRIRNTNAKLIIGDGELPIVTTTPVLRGKKYGLEISSGTVTVTDGIFESELQAQAISTTNVTKPTEFETSGTIDIDGVTYNTAYLRQPSYTVTFDPDNGDNPEEINVSSGSTIGNLIPQDPTKSGYYFDGWYENETLITSSTTVTNTIEAHAKWVRSVLNATVATVPDPFTFEVGQTGQISVTGTDIESVRYSSSDDRIAEVDEYGVVTGTGVGTATITITGLKSTDTQTVTVNVTPIMHTITFNHNNGEEATIFSVADGTSLSTLPATSKTNYIFDGWFIDGDTTTPLTTSVTITGDLTVEALWTPSIKLATVPARVKVAVDRTKTLEITGPVGMESYTFSSGDNSVATVTQNGNVATITGVSIDTTSIIINGSRSNETVTIPLEVTAVITHTVTFKDTDNSIIAIEYAEDDTSLSSLPSAPAKTDYVFDKWYIDGDITTPLTTSVTITGDLTVIAGWKEKISIATITTNPDPFAFKVGSTGQIIVTATGGGKVEDCTFTSSNTNIAEIDTTATTENVGVVFGSSVDTVTITVTGVDSGLSRQVVLNVTNLNDILFDPDNGDPIIKVQVPDGSSVGANEPNYPTKDGYAFDRWYLYDEVNEVLTTTPFDPNEIVTSNKTYKAKWVDGSYFVAIDNANGTSYYDSIKSALSYVPNNTLTELRIIQDITNTSGQTSITSNKNIIINGGKHIISCGASTTNQLLLNNGTLRIVSGSFSCNNSGLAVLQNASTGRMYIEGGTIHNYNNRGAIYNDGGYIEISGGRLSTDATIRPVVQNARAGGSIVMTGGEVIQATTGNVTTSGKDDGRGAIRVIAGSSATIKGGTVISNALNSAAIHVSGGTLVIGTNDDEATTEGDTYDVTSPVIQGENYGIISAVSYSIFDGIIKGKNANGAVDNFNMIDEVSGIEANHTRQTGTDGAYNTLYYVPTQQPQTGYRINFNANGGVVSDEYIEYPLNESITLSDLPTPTRTNHTFDGWYKDDETTIPFSEFIPSETATVTYYAKWTFNSSLTPVSHNILSNAMVEYFNSVSSWVTADATDPSNDPPHEALSSNNYDNGHHLFKDSIDEVFTNNNCSSCGENNACGSPQAGTYCDQPSGYDTGLDEDINVYTFENNGKGTLITYTTSTGGVIYNMIPGVTYYWESASDNTKYGVVSATGNRRTLKTSIRNLRDLGGLSASNEHVTGTIDYGRLYRGAQITTSQGVTDLTKLGVTREVDLRQNGDGNQTFKMTNYDTGTSDPNVYDDIIMTNYIVNPVETTYITVPHMGNYRNVKSAMRAVMEKVVFNHDSIYFHCTIGTDRTGTIAYFLEGLLGVSEEDRLRDYELTYFYGLTNRTRFHDSVSWSNISPRFYSMYRSYPTNADIYNYYKYEPHVVDPNNPNDLTDDELLRRFRLELIH